MSNDSSKECFRNLDIPAVISTGEDEFVTGFYEKMLSQSTDYKRGVGYFTSGWLSANARGMATFAANGGTAKWLTSPHLNERDLEALQHGEKAKKDGRLRSVLDDTVLNLEKELESDTRNAVAWLVADGVLDLRIAVPTGELSGDFHDKWGVFRSRDGDRVAFHGSQNDSASGFTNYESFDIFCDWETDREADRVDRHEDRFDELWENENDAVEVYSLPNSVENDLIQLQTGDRPYSLPESSHGITLRNYQREAVDAWEENGRHGLLEMATGTGKTYTAIGAMDQFLAEQDKPVLIVIAVPYTHLANQWRESLREWGYTDTKFVFGSANRNWKKDLSRTISDLKIGVRDDTILITTHTTFSGEYFKEQIQKTTGPVLLIADEVHGLGSDHRREALIEKYEYRLGLSATPTRYFDEMGTTALKEYFGGIIYEFGISEAIPEYLTEYEYHPHIVEMTDEELDEYAQLSHKLASEMNRENPDENLIERLLIKRSRIIKGAVNKLETLRSIVSDLQERDASDHLLVYTNPKHIDGSQKILNDLGLIQHRFTNEEDNDERETLLEGFAEGRYDSLVAMKCLDEGVDVPSTQRAILMSNSQNPKQFIQRRGRVLRRADELGKDYAEIHDMIVVPSLNPKRDIIESEKNILQRELNRFEEFAADARNPAQARNRIQRLRTEYEI